MEYAWAPGSRAALHSTARPPARSARRESGPAVPGGRPGWCRAFQSRRNRLQRIHQVEQCLARELAALVARQRCDEIQGARQKRRVDVPAQGGAQRALAKLRRDDQRAQALAAVAQIERAVLNAIDSDQRRVQRLERSALAGDLHQAAFATVKGEAALIPRTQLVRDALRLEDMAALHRKFSRALGQAHSGAELPRLVERSAARRDHAGLA